MHSGQRTAPAKPVLATWLGDEASHEARKLFAIKNIASFATPAEGVDGFMQLVSYARAQEQLMRTPPSLPQELAFDSATAASIIQTAVSASQSVLSEVEAKNLLAAYGIPIVQTGIAANPAQVGRLAQEIIARHGACVIKILSDDISHKSDVGGVRLGLEHAEEAERAAADMVRRITQLMPAARIKGFTVQPMIRRSRAHELILGMSVDPTFGPLIMFGTGGTAVEVVRDTAHALPPLDLNLAQDMMQQTRIWRLLQGYRDRPAADIGSVAEALVRLSYLAARHPEIREVDINPIAGRRAGRDRSRRQSKVQPRRPPRPHGDQALSLAVADRHRIRAHRTDAHSPNQTRGRSAIPRLFRRRHAGRPQAPILLGAGPNLSHGFLARLTQIDYAREMAFVAVAQNTGALLGVVRLIADPDYTRVSTPFSCAPTSRAAGSVGG